MVRRIALSARHTSNRALLRSVTRIVLMTEQFCGQYLEYRKCVTANIPFVQ
jgi:hypothetical protein